jgi:hypothetical protein
MNSVLSRIRAALNSFLERSATIELRREKQDDRVREGEIEIDILPGVLFAWFRFKWVDWDQPHSCVYVYLPNGRLKFSCAVGDEEELHNLTTYQAVVMRGLLRVYHARADRVTGFSGFHPMPLMLPEHSRCALEMRG